MPTGGFANGMPSNLSSPSDLWPTTVAIGDEIVTLGSMFRRAEEAKTTAGRKVQRMNE